MTELTILRCKRCDEDFSPIPAQSRYCMTCRELLDLPKRVREKRIRERLVEEGACV